MNCINYKSKRIIMLGPDIEGKGGISRVIKVWKDSKILKDNNIKYVSTVSNSTYLLKMIDFIKSVFYFIFLSVKNCRGVYVHTASRKSFYRKLIFIAISILFSNKIILHIHPTFFYYFINNFRGFKKKIIFYFLNKVSVYVVLTETMKKKFKQLFPQKKVYVLRNPINFDRILNKNNLIRENNRLLFLGWYLKYKGIYDLVDAVKIITKMGYNVKVDLCGTYKINNLKNYVTKNNLTNVKVNGWIYDNEKFNLLYKSTILILPSYSEGIPNVILEAMATKTPIIATSVGGLNEILIDHNNALIVKPKNPVDLSEKILELLENENLREKIATNAYNLAKNNFDISIIKKQFKQILIKTL
jgi:glycosyltransferase involved in cell wall biosynthesis